MKSLTLDDVRKSKSKSVYAVNITTGSLSGPVVIECPKLSTKGSDVIVLPDDGRPIDLLSFTSKEQLLESSQLNIAIRNKMIALLSAADAKKRM